MSVEKASIRPGELWRDTSGAPIHAHGGSIIAENGVFYWYGENKEFTTGEDEIWHWGVRCYRSLDLYNWEDLGLIIEPDPDDPTSPLHPSQHLDRPHIVWNPDRQEYVCWVKVMGSQQGEDQTATVLTSESLLGPYRIVSSFVLPQGLTMGDFDLVAADGRGYIYFEHPHSELVCSDLAADLKSATGELSRHFVDRVVPEAREAPAYFRRGDKHYLLTSGTSGYFPNRTDVAIADDPHGPWTDLGPVHVGDPSGTSLRSQVSSVFRHPGKADLYIALADRWLPHRSPADSDHTEMFRRFFAGEDGPELDALVASAGRDLEHANTSLARYVWLPIRFDGDRPTIEWVDEWSVDEFD